MKNFFDNKIKTIICRKLLGIRCKQCHKPYNKNISISFFDYWMTEKLKTAYFVNVNKFRRPVKANVKSISKETNSNEKSYYERETLSLQIPRTFGSVIQVEVICSHCGNSDFTEINKKYLGKDIGDM